MALLLLAGISTDELRKEFPISPRDEAIVSDAIYRWSGNDEREMEDRIPIVIRFRDKRCVLLYMRRGGLGSDGLFCYDENDKLVEALRY